MEQHGTTATHWGSYRTRSVDGRLVELVPHPDDPEPHPIADGLAQTLHAPGRLTRPMVRRGWLEHGPGPAGTGGRPARGDDVFVPVEWERAFELVAGEIDRVRTGFGNNAIYGGSYGWGSAGRFHHPQSQIHRFLNLAGGYTRSVDTYSSAAITVLLRRVAGGWQTAMDSTPTFDDIARDGELLVSFGGLAPRNQRVNDGGVGAHESAAALRRLAEAGVETVVVTPNREAVDERLGSTWWAARPGTDTAILLALTQHIAATGRQDQDFLDRCTVGWDRYRAYLMGETDGVVKDAAWASRISGLPADTLTALADRICTRRTVISVAYSVQRCEFGEQTPWAALALAAVSGSMGRPGGGFGCGLAAMHRNGSRLSKWNAAAFPQGINAVPDFIPVARISDMLLHPGAEFDYDGGRFTYPDTKLVYWVGGNPFHHHQDLNRLVRAWQRPDTVVVHEHFANALTRHADIVLPAATFAERSDFALGREDPFLTVMQQAAQPPGEVLTDHAILTGIARHLGLEQRFTEGRSADDWVQELYRRTSERIARGGVELPGWDEFVALGQLRLPDLPRPPAPYTALRDGMPIGTSSGRIELFSDEIDSYRYPDCAGHPHWFEPVEWLGSPKAQQFPLALVSGQPEGKLHSQFDNSPHSAAGKVAGREPIVLHPDAAAARGIADGDVVRVFNDRGQCLAGAQLRDSIRPDVVRMSTGSWFDPIESGGLDVHGNPNVLTRDVGTSSLAQGPSAHSALVEVERWDKPVPPVTVYGPLPE